MGKKIFIILVMALATLMVVSCTQRKEVLGTVNYTDKVFASPNTGDLTYRLIEMDSCEYIIADSRMSHRARCKYCADRREKELKELIKEIRNGSEDVTLW